MWRLNWLAFVFCGAVLLASPVLGQTVGTNATLSATDVVKGLSKREAALKSFSVSSRCTTTHDLDPSGKPRLAKLQQEMKFLIDRSGRLRYEMNGQSASLKGERVVVFPWHVFGVIDGVTTRFMDGQDRFTYAVISSHPDSLGFVCDPRRWLTHDGNELLSAKLVRRSISSITRSEWDGVPVLVVEMPPVPVNGADWTRKYYIAPSLGFAVVRQSSLVKFREGRWLEYERTECFGHQQIRPAIWLPQRVECVMLNTSKEADEKGLPPRLFMQQHVKNTDWEVDPKVTDSQFELVIPGGVLVENRITGQDYHTPGFRIPRQ